MEYSNKNILSKTVNEVIWLICYLWLIIDTITGYFLNAGMQMPLSQGIKLLLLICVIFQLLNNLRIAFVINVIIIFFTIIFISTAFYSYSLFSTLTHFSKLLLTILLFLFFKNQLKINEIRFYKRAFLVFKIGLIVLFLNVFSGLFGLGYHTYERDQYGFKGFIYSGNEIGGLIVVLIPVFLYWAYQSLTKTKYYAAVMMSLILGILLSTKSAILIIIIASMAIPYIYGDRRNRRKIIIYGMILVASGIYIVFKKLGPEASNFLEILYYRYDKGGLLLILLSARNDFVLQYFSQFFQSPIFQRFVGMGIGTDGLITVEMDYFDILFYYGYLGLICSIIITVSFFKMLYKNRKNNMLNKTIILSDILMIGMAAIAGHILFSSMAGVYIALLNSLIFAHKKYPLIKKNKYY